MNATTLRSVILVGVLATQVPGYAQLNENCTVSILNRTARVDFNGSWRVESIPALGSVRARATCVENGVTQTGSSSFVTIQPGITNAFDADIVLGVADPVPQSLTVTSPVTTLDDVGATTQLSVSANFPDGTSADVTTALLGTNYSISNPAIATVSGDGLVTAVASGTVLASAFHDGALGVIQLQVLLDGADSDGDGIPDDVEVGLGLNPNNAADALLDFDNDGLTNISEFNLGTQIDNPDSDGDTIQDGEETVAGADGFVTNPLLADSDGDGIRDGLEIQTASDPTDPNSFNLAAALSAIQVAPTMFFLTVNPVAGQSFRQLTVTGDLIDGTTIDLTYRWAYR